MKCCGYAIIFPAGTFKLLATDQVMVFHQQTTNKNFRGQIALIEKLHAITDFINQIFFFILTPTMRIWLLGVCADAVWAEEGLAARERDPGLQGRALTFCGHDHHFSGRKVDRHEPPHHSYAFLGHDGDHDLGQALVLITPYYCNTAANPPPAIQYKRSSTRLKSSPYVTPIRCSICNI